MLMTIRIRRRHAKQDIRHRLAPNGKMPVACKMTSMMVMTTKMNSNPANINQMERLWLGHDLLIGGATGHAVSTVPNMDRPVVAGRASILTDGAQSSRICMADENFPFPSVYEERPETSARSTAITPFISANRVRHYNALSKRSLQCALESRHS
ncbi:MAG TPA: hypothetical protein VGQ65_12815 [Thermoanaerobaculia bacterium]|jgi:hypothetical protein|nr:hypothetical protein [Thermoanaerobaculia bacterium]